jgi:glutathione S-transferase
VVKVSPPLTLYNNEFCMECRVVREKLAELQLTYLCVNVSLHQADRVDVYDLTGQYLVPVLVDRNMVLTARDNILEYLVNHYGGNFVKPMKY